MTISIGVSGFMKKGILAYGIKVFNVLLILFAFYSAAFSADENYPDATLDPSFGYGGIVTTDFSVWIESGQTMVTQPDGKIVVTGYINTSPQHIVLLRYSDDGSLDTTFNGTGIVETSITNFHAHAHGVAFQPDGKILVAGEIHNGSDSDIILIRYNNDGSLDTSFNGTGIVTKDIEGNNDVAYSVVVQPDGKILLAGVGGSNDFALLRYNGDGSLDTTFNGTGIVTTSVTASNSVAYSIVIQPGDESDFKILVGGSGRNPQKRNAFDFALVRYNSDGSLDTSFDSDGIVTTTIRAGNDTALSLALQPTDGKIILAGASQNYYGSSVAHTALVRYNNDGSLDLTFGTDGIVIQSISRRGSDQAWSLAVQHNGKILVAGQTHTTSNQWNNIYLLRYNFDGSLDPNFNGTGIITQDIGRRDDYAKNVSLQPDGKILVSGYSADGSSNVVLLRYQGTPVPTFTVTPSAGARGSIFPYYAYAVEENGISSLGILPDDGYRIESVSGCGGSLLGYTYTTAPVTSDCTVTATFTPIVYYSLDVTVSGQGTVHSAPGEDLQCVDNCSQVYNEGDVVTLTYDPLTNYRFDGWTGDCTGTGDCVVTMDAAKSVVASFSPYFPNPVLLESSQVTYQSIQSAYDMAPTGQSVSDTIKAKAEVISYQDVIFDREVVIHLEGGYDDAFSNVVSNTIFEGTITIRGTGNTVIMKDLIVK